MKRNILSIIIMAICLANLVMTAVMLFAILNNSKNSNNLIMKVAQAIDLELKSETGELSIYDKETYVFTETALTVNLKKDEESSKDVYVVVTGISLMLNKTAEDYTEASAKLTANEILLSDIITSTYGKYTKAEAQENKDNIKDEILLEIADEFETNIVVDISFASVAFQ